VDLICSILLLPRYTSSQCKIIVSAVFAGHRSNGAVEFGHAHMIDEQVPQLRNVSMLAPISQQCTQFFATCSNPEPVSFLAAPKQDPCFGSGRPDGLRFQHIEASCSNECNRPDVVARYWRISSDRKRKF